MNERYIQLRLKSLLQSSCVVIAPNYTPMDWWECDLWAVTRNGYAAEYEIKLSVADFRADAKKSALRSKSGIGWVEQNKHEQIRTSEHAPSRFYYVVPKDMQSLLPEIPEWAGFIVVDGWPKIVKAAPRLHNRKARKREIRLAQTRMWHRYWACLGDIERMQDDHRRQMSLVTASAGGQP